MKIIRLDYRLEYSPSNIVLYDAESAPMSEEQCREIISPIILELSKILKPEVMLKLTFASRDEADGDYQFIADFWLAAKEKYLF